ncbi:hypothetical protein BJP27_01800 [Pseudomonas oryzihabitans]|nr:hypothetical protein BJP27_01800 [Pseudomonas psychrotolerans]
MIRDVRADEKYWEDRISKDLEWLKECNRLVLLQDLNRDYFPQFFWDASKDILQLILRKYSAGKTIFGLKEDFSILIERWLVSDASAEEICQKLSLSSCRDWVFDLKNLNHYNWSLWLVGLALALEIPNDQWQKLLELIGGEGEDFLLDLIVKSRDPSRKIGTVLLHPKPYARLLTAIQSPQEQQAKLLYEFVGHWYSELEREDKSGLWWYTYGDPEKNPLEKGAYFGRWCIEAVAAVKAFGLDDSLCLGHEHYPGDLLRPAGPTTHSSKKELKKGWLKRFFK